MKLNKHMLGIAFACAIVTNSFAQSSPGWTYGQVPTPGMWNGAFAAKQDLLGYTPLNQAGGTMLGPLKTAPSTTSGAGFSIFPGAAPNAPNNGDIWLTSSGLYYQANNIIFGPIGAGTITGPATTTVGNIAKWGNTNGTALVDGGPLGTAATQNTGTSGHNLPFLDGVNTWSRTQTISPGTWGGTWVSVPAGTGGQLIGQRNGVNRWEIRLPSESTESGSNSGGDFEINRFNDAGTFIDAPFYITRSTGLVSLADGLTVTGPTTLNTALGVGSGGTGGTTQATARAGIGAAASGANSDITSLSGLTTALSIAQGGTGGTSQATAQSSLGLGSMATQSASSVTITGGTINGTSVGATTASTGRFTTVTATGAITPSSTNGIVGTTTNDNANAGSIGEFVQSEIAQGSAISLTTNTPANVTSISLTAGDWDVWGEVGIQPAGTTALQATVGWISTTSATLPSTPNGGAYAQGVLSYTTGNNQFISGLRRRISVSTTTTVYLSAQANFTTSTCQASGGIYARRVR